MCWCVHVYVCVHEYDVVSVCVCSVYRVWYGVCVCIFIRLCVGVCTYWCTGDFYSYWDIPSILIPYCASHLSYIESPTPYWQCLLDKEGGALLSAYFYNSYTFSFPLLSALVHFSSTVYYTSLLLSPLFTELGPPLLTVVCEHFSDVHTHALWKCGSELQKLLIFRWPQPPSVCVCPCVVYMYIVVVFQICYGVMCCLAVFLVLFFTWSAAQHPQVGSHVRTLYLCATFWVSVVSRF